MALKNELKKLAYYIKSVFYTGSFQNPGIKSKITANIICKNNLNTLKPCLLSLIKVVDEIVIIDTGSTDGTLKFITDFLEQNFTGTGKSFTLIEEPSFKSYSYHRNQAISVSKGDWILVVDSDEFLSIGLQKILRKLTHSKIYSAYKFFRRWITKFDTNSADYISTTRFKGRYKSIIRLFRNLPEIRYQGEIHEAVFGLETKRIQTISEAQGTMYHLDVAVNSFEVRKAKVDKREAFLAGSGHPEEYLPELFNISTKPVPDEDLASLSL